MVKRHAIRTATKIYPPAGKKTIPFLKLNDGLSRKRCWNWQILILLGQLERKRRINYIIINKAKMTAKAQKELTQNSQVRQARGI